MRDKEAAEHLTRATRVLKEALKLQRGDQRAPASNYFELKLNITTFCALLHTLFGDMCGYYIALMGIRNCLDSAGVYNICQAYSADICHRISWAIMDDGRAFFSTVMIQLDFGHPNPTFPESLVESILPDVRYANQIMRANYPTEWQPRRITPTQAAVHGGGPQIAWTATGGLPPAPPPAANAPRQQAATNKQGSWTDNRHPSIVFMMAPYITKLGDNVYVGDLLDATNSRISDLPIPVGTRFASKDGTRAFLCWNAVLGRCKFGNKCKYKKNHPGAGELPDEFVSRVVTLLQPAVTHVVATKESPTKKVKTEVVNIE